VADRPDARIFPLLELEAARTAARDAGIAEVLANVNLFRTTLHHPPMARVVADIVGAIVLDSVLDARWRESAILRVGWRLGSVYEWSNHYVIARRAGMTDDEILSIRQGAGAVDDPALRAVLRVVDDIFERDAASAEAIEAARVVVGDDRALLELVTIPGLYRAIGAVLATFAVPLEDHVAPWAPDGRGPSVEFSGSDDRYSTT
jgi:alkylhydroperoxidase family enzyme